eukprot:8583842-Pyramimonas_sp.AAC.1
MAGTWNAGWTAECRRPRAHARQRRPLMSTSALRCNAWTGISSATVRAAAPIASERSGPCRSAVSFVAAGHLLAYLLQSATLHG